MSFHQRLFNSTTQVKRNNDMKASTSSNAPKRTATDEYKDGTPEISENPKSTVAYEPFLDSSNLVYSRNLF